MPVKSRGQVGGGAKGREGSQSSEKVPFVKLSSISDYCTLL